VRGVGISTSGDAEQWVEIAGQRYSHIVDPSTGLGLTGRRSVTVVADDAMTSDMLATAVNVLGPDEGIALVERTAGVAALVGTVAQGQESWRRSRAWRW
jgi:thiamine biosynthesis lipoprotein